MNNLLDTHTLIWFINGDNNLSDKAKKEIELKAPNNFISIASVWEIAIKVSVGKLKLNTSFEDFINKNTLNSFYILSISPVDALVVSSLPLLHRDPFDRMIIAQAQNNHLKIITKDGVFREYKVPVLW